MLVHKHSAGVGRAALDHAASRASSNPSSSFPESLSAANETHTVREGKMGQERWTPFISHGLSLIRYARLAYCESHALRGRYAATR